MIRDVLREIASITLGAGAAVALARQCRKPSWWPGRLILRSMNLGHAGVTGWGLSHIHIQNDFTMLDVGCGGGKTIDTLASLATGGRVYGVDYSSESVNAARRTNARWIDEGRVDVRLGSVSRLAFPADTFDVVTAVETHYYWPNLAKDVQEILRVLAPGGRLVIIAETYKGRRLDWLYRPAMRLLRATYLTVAEHRQVLSANGYTEVDVFEERSKGWICAVGRKPL